MTQYVIQIQTEENGLGVGWLAKSFQVGEETPIPDNVPSNRVQIVLTKTQSYNEIIAVYGQYNRQEKGELGVLFSYDAQNERIYCVGAVEKTWDIN